MIALLTVGLLGALDHTIVSTSLATIAGDLGALGNMGWSVFVYTLASTVLLPVLGRLADVVGARPVFLASLAGFLIASAACGFAQDMTFLIVARVLQGMSSAGLHLMSQTIVAHVTTPRERPRVMSLIGIAFPVAILVGPVIGGLIADFWGWPWLFWINLPFGIAAFALAAFAVPRIAPGARRGFDYAGAAAFTASLTAIVLGVTWMGEPETAPAAVTAFVIGGIAFAGFVLIEQRAPQPILSFRVLRDRTVAVGVTLSAIIGLGLFAIVAYLPTYFQMAYRTTATVSGLVPIATVLGMLVSNLLTGALIARSGRYRMYPILGTALASAGLLVMALLPLGPPLWVPMIVMAVVGIGIGSFMNVVVAVVQSAAPREELGAVTATTNVVRQVGSTLGTAIVGGVIGAGVASLLPSWLDAETLTPQALQGADAAVQDAVASAYHDIFAPIFIVIAAVYAVGVVVALLLPPGRLTDDEIVAADEVEVATR
jgi:EmrB/QacA subfamily drug resistance transporter